MFGVALIRRGIEARSWMLIAGAARLVIYRCVVNRESVDFGRLMGTYIAVLFEVSQIIAMTLYREWRTIAGGALIIAGGFTIIG